MKLTWTSLAVKEWRRRPLRSSITAAGIALAVAALASLISFQRGYQRGLRSELDRLGAHVLVVPKGCPFDAASIALHGANWPCYLRADYLAEVRAIPLVATAAPAFMNAFPATDGSQNIFVGVTEDILALKPGWRIEGRFPKAAGELLVGADVARRRGWKVGDPVRVAELPGRDSVVTGVLAPTQGADDTFIFLPLAAAQQGFRRERQLTHILVRLRDPNDLDDAVTQLRGCNAGMDMNIVPLTHLFRTIQGLVNSTRLWLGCVAAIALLVAAAGVSNALLMAVTERTREIGILRAIGASRSDVFRLFWLEALQLCLLGGVAGLLAAFVSSRGIESWLRSRLPFAPTDALIHAEPWVALVCLAGVTLLGGLAGFLPAWRAARLEPIVAMRTPGGGW